MSCDGLLGTVVNPVRYSSLVRRSFDAEFLADVRSVLDHPEAPLRSKLPDPVREALLTLHRIKGHAGLTVQHFVDHVWLQVTNIDASVEERIIVRRRCELPSRTVWHVLSSKWVQALGATPTGQAFEQVGVGSSASVMKGMSPLMVVRVTRVFTRPDASAFVDLFAWPEALCARVVNQERPLDSPGESLDAPSEVPHALAVALIASGASDEVFGWTRDRVADFILERPSAPWRFFHPPPDQLEEFLADNGRVLNLRSRLWVERTRGNAPVGSFTLADLVREVSQLSLDRAKRVRVLDLSACGLWASEVADQLPALLKHLVSCSILDISDNNLHSSHATPLFAAVAQALSQPDAGRRQVFVDIRGSHLAEVDHVEMFVLKHNLRGTIVASSASASFAGYEKHCHELLRNADTAIGAASCPTTDLQELAASSHASDAQSIAEQCDVAEKLCRSNDEGVRAAAAAVLVRASELLLKGRFPGIPVSQWSAAESRRLLELAATCGRHARAALLLALLFLECPSSEERVAEALRWVDTTLSLCKETLHLMNAVECCDVLSQAYALRHHALTLTAKADWQAVDVADSLGNPEAPFFLAMRREPELEILLRSADRGSADAMYEIATLLSRKTRGRRRAQSDSPSESGIWLRLASEYRNPTAMLHLASEHLSQLEREFLDSTAMSQRAHTIDMLLRRAEKQAPGPALFLQAHLRLLCSESSLRTNRFPLVVDWLGPLLLAAHPHKYPAAVHALGMLFARGIAVCQQPDVSVALMYFQQAADLEFADSWYDIALLKPADLEEYLWKGVVAGSVRSAVALGKRRLDRRRQESATCVVDQSQVAPGELRFKKGDKVELPFGRFNPDGKLLARRVADDTTGWVMSSAVQVLAKDNEPSHATDQELVGMLVDLAVERRLADDDDAYVILARFAFESEVFVDVIPDQEEALEVLHRAASAGNAAAHSALALYGDRDYLADGLLHAALLGDEDALWWTKTVGGAAALGALPPAGSVGYLMRSREATSRVAAEVWAREAEHRTASFTVGQAAERLRSLRAAAPTPPRVKHPATSPKKRLAKCPSTNHPSSPSTNHPAIFPSSALTV